MAQSKVQFLRCYHQEVKGDTVKIIPVQCKAKGKGIKNGYKEVEVSWIAVSKKDMSFYLDLNFPVLTKSSSNEFNKYKGFSQFSKRI